MTELLLPNQEETLFNSGIVGWDGNFYQTKPDFVVENTSGDASISDADERGVQMSAGTTAGDDAQMVVSSHGTTTTGRRGELMFDCLFSLSAGSFSHDGEMRLGFVDTNDLDRGVCYNIADNELIIGSSVVSVDVERSRPMRLRIYTTSEFHSDPETRFQIWEQDGNLVVDDTFNDASTTADAVFAWVASGGSNAEALRIEHARMAVIV